MDSFLLELAGAVTGILLLGLLLAYIVDVFRRPPPENYQ